MRETFSCSFWLIFAGTSLVLSSLLLTVPRAGAQDFSSARFSSYLAEGLQLRNLSFVGKAIFAECFCKQMEFAMRMCAAWKLVQPSFQISQIKVFKKFFTGPAVQGCGAVKGSCKEYANNIINGLYRSDHLNYSIAQQPATIDWGFCEDMRLRNNMGCNYTIVPSHNSSMGTRVHYFVPSFTNASQHLRLGTFYQLHIEKCKGTVCNIRVSVVSDLPSQPKTTAGFFVLPIKTRTSELRTSRTAPSADKDQRNEGMVLADNNTLCAAAFLAVLLMCF